MRNNKNYTLRFHLKWGSFRNSYQRTTFCSNLKVICVAWARKLGPNVAPQPRNGPFQWAQFFAMTSMRFAMTTSIKIVCSAERKRQAERKSTWLLYQDKSHAIAFAPAPMCRWIYVSFTVRIIAKLCCSAIASPELSTQKIAWILRFIDVASCARLKRINALHNIGRSRKNYIASIFNLYAYITGEQDAHNTVFEEVALSRESDLFADSVALRLTVPLPACVYGLEIECDNY